MSIPSSVNNNYITPEGERVLRNELRQLWRVERPEWTQRVSDAAKEGDRSENAEYIYSKKKLREIDRRVRFLTKRLEALTVVRRVPKEQSKIFFGAWVTLETIQGTVRYRLVGGDEFDQHPDYISINSPLARNLLGKSVSDSFTLLLAEKSTDYEILAVSYNMSDDINLNT